MKKQLITAVLYTAITTLILGLGYPLGMTLLAHLLMPQKASGSLIVNNGVLAGSRLIGQPFNSAGYFHSRPSSAGAGYDAANSSGSNLGPTNATLIARVQQSVHALQASQPKSAASSANVPADLVTTSGSGLDPDISIAAAEYQAPIVARDRGLQLEQVLALVRQRIEPRQFGVLGEPRVNVLELNLALDQLAAKSKAPVSVLR